MDVHTLDQLLEDVQSRIPMHLGSIFVINEAFANYTDMFPVRVGDTMDGRGRGVFTTRRVAKGDVLTLHGCDAIVTMYVNKGRNLVTGSDWLPSADAQARYSRYLGRSQSGDTLLAVGDPEREPEAHNCGHLINDPHPDARAICVRPDSQRAMWKAVLDYEAAVAPRTNCAFRGKGAVVACVASRDIEEGEEVLAPYGYEFWCKLPAKQGRSWAKRGMQQHQHLPRLQEAQQHDEPFMLFKGPFTDCVRGVEMSFGV